MNRIMLLLGATVFVVLISMYLGDGGLLTGVGKFYEEVGPTDFERDSSFTMEMGVYNIIKKIDVRDDDFESATLWVYGKVEKCDKDNVFDVAKFEILINGNSKQKIEFSACEIFDKDYAWQRFDLNKNWVNRDETNTVQLEKTEGGKNFQRLIVGVDKSRDSDDYMEVWDGSCTDCGDVMMYLDLKQEDDNKAPEVSVDYPDAEEVLSGEVDIEWTATDDDGDELEISLYYLRDEGYSVLIADELENDGEYTWDTTKIDDWRMYKIKIVASDGTESVYGFSDGYFLIKNSNNAPEVEMKVPNGDKHIVPDSFRVEWTASDDDEIDELDASLYYKKGSGEYTLIADNLLGYGGWYLWDVSKLEDGDDYMIKVVVSDKVETASDESDDYFEIERNVVPEVTVDYPDDEGEKLSGEIGIEWTATDGNGEDVSINLYYQKGTADSVGIAFEVDNDGKYTWDTNDVEDGTDYKIVVSAGDVFSTGRDSSDNYFEIANTPEVSVDYPDEEGLELTGEIDIEWTATDPGEDELEVSIYYQKGDGIYTLIAEDEENDGKYTWDTNDVEDGEYVIKVVASDGKKSAYDSSDNFFETLNEPDVSVDYPDEEGLELTGEIDIEWTASDPGEDTLKIHIYYGSGDSYTLIAKSEENDGEYTWDTNNAEDGEYVIKVVASDGKREAIDHSDNQFETINAPEVTVDYPEGGETMTGDVDIEWTATDPGEDSLEMSIYYQKGDGDPVLIAEDEENDGEYTWDTTEVDNGAGYSVKVVAYDGKINSYDYSDASSRIKNGNSAPTVKVDSPNEELNFVGEKQYITWTATDDDEDELEVSIYYQKGENDPVLIAEEEENDREYTWDNTDLEEGDDYRIMIVVSDGEETDSDYSDKYFEISNAPEITVLDPNGGETVSGEVEIVWTARDPTGDELEISLYYQKGEADPVLIADELENEGDYSSYIWDTTKVDDGTAYKIKAVASDGENEGEDLSDAVFEIDNS